jgi:hypothetical protein
MALTNPPQSVKIDALNRAARTLYTAFGADALILIGFGLTDLLSKEVDIATWAFWSALGLLVVKSLLTALGSYLLRLKKAPNVDPNPNLTA